MLAESLLNDILIEHHETKLLPIKLSTQNTPKVMSTHLSLSLSVGYSM